MKRSCIIILSAILVFIFVLSGCTGGEKTSQDDSQLTMFIGLGYTSGTYYQDLHDAILENTGIDVKMVKFNTADTSNKILDMLDNGETPADIIITASKTPDDIQEKAFLSLSSHSDVTKLFKENTVLENTIGNDVYQLPFGSTIVGIEYNKTLFNELGWELPQTFDDMLALKAKADEAGILFAVTGDCISGAGMLHLMNLIGTEYISTLAGTEWLDKFIAGKAGVDEIQEAFDYFVEFKEAGLFGEIDYSKWTFSGDFKKKRALFLFEDICRTSDGYNGPLYTQDGQETDTIINDEYGVMPFISKDGDNNCFVTYDAMNVALSKQLGEKANKKKLEKAIKVLEFMASEEGIKVQTDLYRDAYVAVKNFKADDNRLYADFSQQISEGYTMQQYAFSFDTNTIVNTGEAVRSYLAGRDGVTADSILEIFQTSVKNNLLDEDVVIATVPETLDFEDTAKLLAIVSAQNLQKTIINAGINVEVQVSLMPYIESFTDLPLSSNYGAVQSKIYAGNFTSLHPNMTVGKEINAPVGIYMTGAEIKAIVANGFNRAALELGETDCGRTEYVCITKNNMELNDEDTYLVSVSATCLLTSEYTAFAEAGKVLTNGDAGTVTGNTISGLTDYCTEHGTIKIEDLNWN